MFYNAPGVPYVKKALHPGRQASLIIMIWANDIFQLVIKEVMQQDSNVEVGLTASPSPPKKSKLAPTAAGSVMAGQSSAPPLQEEWQPSCDEKNGHSKDGQMPAVAKDFQTQGLSNGKTRSNVTKPMSKRKMSQHKEKKATQMLAIVLGE